MIAKTQGIVFKTIKYADNSLIAKVFTEAFGMRSYLVRGLNGKGGSTRKSAFRQLSILDLVVYEKNRGNLQNIKEIVSIYPYSSMPFDVKKQCIAMFINEIMYRSIHSEEPDAALYHFLKESLLQLDSLETAVENFHLNFIASLTGFLGFAPRNNFSASNAFFDLQEGFFVSDQPIHNNFMNKRLSAKMFHLISNEYPSANLFTNAASRNEFLLKMIDYYRLHIPVFGEIKSHVVLKDLLA
jgi:DNA repair protein RecO (recombination protein O)